MTPQPRSPRHVEQRAGRISAGRGQHVAGQRSLRRGSRRASGAGVRRRRARSAIGRSSGDGASNSASPTTWAACRNFAAGLDDHPRSARHVGVSAGIPLYRAAVSARTRCRGALEHSRPYRGAVGRRHRISTAQDSALRHLGCGRRTRHDLPAQGTRARPRAAALPRHALCHGRRQAEPVGRDEIRP